MELEEVLELKKQLVDVQPIDVHYLSIATTFIQLGRYLRLTKLMFSIIPILFCFHVAFYNHQLCLHNLITYLLVTADNLAG